LIICLILSSEIKADKTENTAIYPFIIILSLFLIHGLSIIWTKFRQNSEENVQESKKNEIIVLICFKLFFILLYLKLNESKLETWSWFIIMSPLIILFGGIMFRLLHQEKSYLAELNE